MTSSILVAIVPSSCQNDANSTEISVYFLILQSLRTATRIITATAIIGCCATWVNAATIGYAVSNDSNNYLYHINMDTGVATKLGATRFSKIEGLALNAKQELFGVTSNAQLIKCDLSTGACSAVGTLPNLTISASTIGLAFASDGRLYLSILNYLLRINTDNATYEVVSNNASNATLAGLAASYNSACASGLYGLGGNGSNRGQLYCITNIASGNNATFATINGTLSNNIQPLDGGLDTDTTIGTIWGITDNSPAQIFTIDPITLNTSRLNIVTLNGQSISGFESLAIAPSSIAPGNNEDNLGIPVLSKATLLSLSLLLVSIAALLLRSRSV